MLKSILLLVCVGLCLAKIPLRDPQYWTLGNTIDLLNKYMGGFNFGKDQLQQETYLTELAQAVAESETNPHEFLKNYKHVDGLNVLVFGIKLNGTTNYKQILTENFNSVMEGMPGFLNFRYKNNTLNVDVNQLKELMDLTSCDTMTVPLNCNERAVKNLWRAGTGVFNFQNENYHYKVKANNMLRVFEAMADDRKNRYTLDIFKNTASTFSFKNENYEMEFDVPDLFGSGFWSSEQNGVWGIGDQVTALLTHGGHIKATSVVEHQYLKVNLEINEPFVEPTKPTRRLTDEELRDEFESHFKTMYEMFDREQVFNSFNKYGYGYALDSNGNINIVLGLSSPISDEVRVLNRTTRLNLFNRLKQWPWFAPAPASTVHNPLDKKSLVDIWNKALVLSMGPINEDRKHDGLPELVEKQSLTILAQSAADKMASEGQFVAPSFQGENSNVLIVSMKLSSQTKINEYAFLINENNFGQVTCFDNFSNIKHRIVNIIDNERYVCSKNSKSKEVLEMWKKYTSYGTGHAITPSGDAFMTIALGL